MYSLKRTKIPGRILYHAGLLLATTTPLNTLLASSHISIQSPKSQFDSHLDSVSKFLSPKRCIISIRTLLQRARYEAVVRKEEYLVGYVMICIRIRVANSAGGTLSFPRHTVQRRVEFSKPCNKSAYSIATTGSHSMLGHLR